MRVLLRRPHLVDVEVERARGRPRGRRSRSPRSPRGARRGPGSCRRRRGRPAGASAELGVEQEDGALAVVADHERRAGEVTGSRRCGPRVPVPARRARGSGRRSTSTPVTAGDGTQRDRSRPPRSSLGDQVGIAGSASSGSVTTAAPCDTCGSPGTENRHGRSVATLIPTRGSTSGCVGGGVPSSSEPHRRVAAAAGRRRRCSGRCRAPGTAWPARCTGRVSRRGRGPARAASPRSRRSGARARSSTASATPSARRSRRWRRSACRR